MPVLPSGHVVGISSERARYHATRQNIRVTHDTPHLLLYHLVDIVYVEPHSAEENWSKNYKFTGHTLADHQWLLKWKEEDRRAFLDWLSKDSQFLEIEDARKKIIYDTLPHRIKSYDYPARLYSLLQRRIASMQMSSASPGQWRNTILNMHKCGVREEEFKWSGILDFLDQAETANRGKITREELLSRIDFSDIRLELTNELVRDEECPLEFDETASIMPYTSVRHSGITLADGDYPVLRFVNRLFNYRIILVRSPRAPLAAARWFVLTPHGKALPTSDDSETGAFDNHATAMRAASRHARIHYGLQSALHHNDKYAYMSLHGGDDYREWLVTLPDFQASHFTSHFTERNVLLHFRTKTRLDLRGRRLLFIEEIQSDWHQQAGGRGNNRRWQARIPEAPFHKEWSLLAVKLLLLHAADEGYEGIAWTPGTIQQQRYQSDIGSLLRLYDRDIPQHLTQLSRQWHAGRFEQTIIRTKQPWLSPRRNGDYWSVNDKLGHFTTRARFTRDEATALSWRHSKSVDLTVPVFLLKESIRARIRSGALPLFGEMIIDRVKRPLCDNSAFTRCDPALREACMSHS